MGIFDRTQRGNITNPFAPTSGGGGGGITWSTPVDANVVPDGDTTRSLGVSGLRFLETRSRDIYLQNLYEDGFESLVMSFGPGEASIRSGQQLTFRDSGETFSTSFRAGAATTSVTYDLPPADGTSGQVLSTNGSGILSWETVSAAPPTGTQGVAFFDAFNVLSSQSNFLYDDSTKSLVLRDEDSGGLVFTNGITQMAIGGAAGVGAELKAEGGNASFAHGYASGGIIYSTGFGSIASGVADGGSINAFGNGSHAFGRTDTGTITTNDSGSFATGYALSSGDISATGPGSTAIGVSFGSGATITSSGTGSFAGGNDTQGQILSTFNGSFAFGNIGGASASRIRAQGNGCFALGSTTSGGIIDSSGGAGNFCFANISGSGTATAQGAGSFAVGFVNGSGTLTSNGNGSFALGVIDGSSPTQMTASGLGSFAHGVSQNSANISAASRGSFARGFAVGSSSLIQANNADGTFASGLAESGGIIRAQAGGSHSFGSANNGTISSGNAGAIAHGRAQGGGSITANGFGSYCGGYVDSSAVNTETSGLGSFAFGQRHNVTGNYAQAFGIGHANSTFASLVCGQFAAASGTATSSVATDIAFAVGIGVAGTPANGFSVGKDANLKVYRTITPALTTGDQTINRPSGTVNFAAAATSLTVTNNLVNVDSIILAVVRTNDSTATIKNVVPAAGSFVINLGAAATAETSVGFLVLN